MPYSFNFDAEPFIDVDVVASGMGPAVVPLILRWDRDDRTVHSQGTAFCLAGFTSGDALFATARHVVAELAGQEERVEPFLLIPNARDPSNLIGVQITQVRLASTYSDVALLVARPSEAVVPVVTPKILQLTFAPPRVGENTMALGYEVPALGQPGVIKVSYELKAARGEVVEVHERRRGGLVDFPSFRTTGLYKHSMSGGPIIDTDGLVVGIISTGYETSEPPPIGYGACTGALAELTVELTNDESVVEELSVARLADLGILGAGGIELRLDRDEKGVTLSWPTE
ncbi:MAG TPA: serine protease [Solirubrobacteraceae bacterium]|nr:serine protease [Solirubrobacteraceae bacterium]